jgi:hypothetical protein
MIKMKKNMLILILSGGLGFLISIVVIEKYFHDNLEYIPALRADGSEKNNVSYRQLIGENNIESLPPMKRIATYYYSLIK